MWIWIHNWVLHLPFSSLFYLYFFSCMHFRGDKNSLITYCLTLFTHYSSIVHALFMGSTVTLLKKILKMGLTVLFIHLKIIFLQYFQFSISTKISCIQTDLKIWVEKSYSVLCFTLAIYTTTYFALDLWPFSVLAFL